MGPSTYPTGGPVPGKEAGAPVARRLAARHLEEGTATMTGPMRSGT
jgi:hypothetical protein